MHWIYVKAQNSSMFLCYFEIATVDLTDYSIVNNIPVDNNNIVNNNNIPLDLNGMSKAYKRTGNRFGSLSFTYVWLHDN